MDPFDVGSSGRMAAIADSGGAALCLWQSRDHKGSQVVNAPGAWLSSTLNTRDPEQAAAFYGSVFGWEVASEADGEPATLLLAGYGDHLEQNDPDLRKRLAGRKAPERFEDTVAWMAVVTDDRFPPGTPEHWGIVFGVARADDTAAPARELGGTVLVEPFDVPWATLLVVADPDGAVFTAGEFRPPS